MHDLSGALVDKDDGAQTFAEFFETRQWAVRPVTYHVSNVQLAPTLQLSNNDISSKEVVTAARLLKPKKAGGLDELPPEFWKGICREDSPACKWAVELCNRVWIHTDVPRSWHEALFSAVFKQGDVALCENYRPISLLIETVMVGLGKSRNVADVHLSAHQHHARGTVCCCGWRESKCSTFRES